MCKPCDRICYPKLRELEGFAVVVLHRLVLDDRLRVLVITSGVTTVEDQINNNKSMLSGDVFQLMVLNRMTE